MGRILGSIVPGDLTNISPRLREDAALETQNDMSLPRDETAIHSHSMSARKSRICRQVYQESLVFACLPEAGVLECAYHFKFMKHADGNAAGNNDYNVLAKSCSCAIDCQLKACQPPHL
jgi:hypothetical protein